MTGSETRTMAAEKRVCGFAKGELPLAKSYHHFGIRCFRHAKRGVKRCETSVRCICRSYRYYASTGVLHNLLAKYHHYRKLLAGPCLVILVYVGYVCLVTGKSCATEVLPNSSTVGEEGPDEMRNILRKGNLMMS